MQATKLLDNDSKYTTQTERCGCSNAIKVTRELQNVYLRHNFAAHRGVQVEETR
jgi:hypothetical protein